MSETHGTSGDTMANIPGYELTRELRRGGMGQVFLARQHALNRTVCVKLLANPEGVEPEECRARFRREAELLASVSHTHILSVFDYGLTADTGVPFLVTEYIEGGDLRRRMKVGQAMPLGEARTVLLQVGEALTFLHGKGILHRDLKPENILLPAGSPAKVCDFGIAVMQDQAGILTRSVRGMGTVGYVSPEQQYGLKVDARSDEYSLAAVSYELLTGRRALGQFLPPSRINHRLPPDVDSVILKGLAEDPKHRYSTVLEFTNALDRALNQARHSSRFGPMLGAIAVILLVLTVVAWQKFIGPLRAPEMKAPVQGPTDRFESAKEVEKSRGGPQEPAKPEPPSRSPEFEKLTRDRAFHLWQQLGSPVGIVGETVKDRNWSEAERQIEDEVNIRAYRIWKSQGEPQGEAGEAVRLKNQRAAEIELLREMEERQRRSADSTGKARTSLPDRPAPVQSPHQNDRRRP